MTTGFNADAIAAPRLRFSDDRIWTLVKLLSDAVNDPDPSAQLYGDGLIAAIAARLFAASRESVADARGSRPTSFSESSNIWKRICPGVLSLRSWRISRACRSRNSAGRSRPRRGWHPRWQLDARIRRAQTLLIDTSASLDDVAEAPALPMRCISGATFRKLTGATPAAWRHDRKN